MLIFCGAAVGIAFLSKFSALILIPIFGIIFLLTLNEAKIPKRILKTFGIGILMLFIAGIIVWAGYGFKIEKAAAKPGESFSTVYEGKGNLPIPAKQYLRGLKTVKTEAEGHKAYLNGKADDTGQGWWYYFPFTFVYKTSWVILIFIALTILAFALPKYREKIKLPPNEVIFLSVPLIIYFLGGLGLLGISLNLGIRHLLPIYPFIYIFAGALGKIAEVEFKDKKKYPLAIITTLSAVLLLLTLSNHPNYISFFNLKHGDRYLIDSNFDWGQELEKLLEFDTQGNMLYFGYFGTTPPESIGLGSFWYFPGMGIMSGSGFPPDEYLIRPAYLAISATILRGGKVYSGVDYEQFLKDNDAEFVQMIGKTIYIYRLNERVDIESWRTAPTYYSIVCN